MIKGIGHLGIVVKDMEKSLMALSKIIEFQKPVIKEFPDKKMRCAVVETKGVSLEFLQDNSDEGPLSRFNRDKGDSIHHFCLLSDNIEEDVEALKKKGIEMMDERPRIGLRGKKIAMTMPGALNGITVELSEP
ncbi:MAG TPA: VOC family protein [Thermodesulfobacteriota bacterium]|nr:VOC family protein [Thermodesulfobacteriota bacterium]